MKISLVFGVISVVSVALLSCSKEDNNVNGPVGGATLDQAKAGAIIRPVSSITGVTDAQMVVKSVENGVSNIELSALVTNPTLKAIAQLQNQYCTVHGDTVKGTFGARVTNEGIQLVAAGKNSTIVRFEDGVGTKYTSEVTSRTKSIVSKSTTDDYPYGFMNIKVSKVEEQIMVGGSKVIVHFFANHKFGLAGIEINFEDGSKIQTNF